MLKYTGHPLVDVGAATIAAFVGEVDLAAIGEQDLGRVADFIAENYVVDPLKSFLNVAFPNSGYTQPAFEKAPEKRREYARRVLRGYPADTPRLAETCPFTGERAVATALSDSLPAGRAFRQHVPLLTGEGVINFHPWGNAGLPVSGKALLCIQAFPLGCAKCGGKLLAVHSDNSDLIYDFAREFLEENRRALSLAQQSGSNKMPEAKASAKTLLVETLLKVEQRRRDEAQDRRPSSVTAYHLSNSGQSNPLDARNPPLEIYHLPLELTDFLSQIVSPDYKAEWQKIEARAWQLPRPKKKAADEQADDDRPRRNLLYEDLFRLPMNAPAFVRRYLLRIPVRTRFEDDPRRTYSLRGEANLVSWKLTELFMRKVMTMDKDRVQQIRDLGDRLANYVLQQDDKRFFAGFLDHRYNSFRTALLRANIAHVRAGNPPLITLDPYVEVFEEGDDLERRDWRLARDLVLIRMVEQLHQQGWLGSHPDAIPEVGEEPEAAS
ncbi:MAG: type I-B CRISPR-associated protein Cas8b1/Cst1 [Chloroflexi bacterium]|nr:type I-B CRISPR-associated protein Cas8b1/Cst1 [Chloroflexota bacterium]